MYTHTNVGFLEKEDISASNINDIDAYGENMTTEIKKTKIEIGFGENYYYKKDFDNPVKEYRLGSYLEFSLDNKELLNYIYKYFNYDKQQKETLYPTKGWLIPGASINARRPNMYFKSEKLLIAFLDYLSEKVELVEIKSGVVLSPENQEMLIRERVN